MFSVSTFLPVVICGAAFAAGAVQSFDKTSAPSPVMPSDADSALRAQSEDMNCSDFPTHKAAQIFFEASGPGDPHELDGNRDGRACSSRGPKAGYYNPPDVDCIDFPTWREAQDFFERAGAHDPHLLDADNDELACESLMTRADRDAISMMTTLDQSEAHQSGISLRRQ